MSNENSNICIINAENGVGTSSPQISQFTHNFDAIKFIMNKDFTNYAVTIITSIDGIISVVNEGENLIKTYDEKNEETNLLWYPQGTITSESGCVIYQIAAYDAKDNLNSIWYSKEGRLIVTDSIDTTDYSTQLIGSSPNLITQILTLAKSLEIGLSEISKKKVDKQEGKGLSQNDYTDAEKKKLDDAKNLAENNAGLIADLAEDITGHKNSLQNPHGVNKMQLGLENVDNTSDAKKPISDAANAEFKNIRNILNEKAFSKDLSAAALSGSYNDLSDKPVTITDLGKFYDDESLYNVLDRCFKTGIYKYSKRYEAAKDDYDCIVFVLEHNEFMAGSTTQIKWSPNGMSRRYYYYNDDDYSQKWSLWFNFFDKVEYISYKSASISGIGDNLYYPTTRAVYNFVKSYIDEKILDTVRIQTPSTLDVNKEYILGELTDLSIAFPAKASIGDVVYVNFTSGATPTTLTIDTTNTCDIEVVPEANTGYEIFGKFNGSIWVVGYSDYIAGEV